MSQLLITGGAGFIGSHTCLVLLEAGHELVVLDDFSNSSPEALRRVQELAGPLAAPRLQLIEGDLRSGADLKRAFAAAPIEAVVHFAGLKAVAESVADPLRYWDVNLCGSRALLAAMVQAGCRTIVFSSSATLYGAPETVPIAECARVAPVNPYGYTKAAVEQMLADVWASEPGWRVARLRYFNPVGAHPSGRIGEDPGGIPNNLFPFLSQVAVGRRPRLQVFGSDWPTPDGTGVRDYIHVMDLADGHRAALEVLMVEPPQLLTLNLGSGRGHSVLEVVAAFERACGSPVPYDLVPRRSGDVAATVADPSLAERRLAWRTHRDLDAICRDGWAWQSANPQGYGPRGD
ncbi:UDP-glucose 4-epimerase GalE [Synechococcus sp. Cruz-9H2]|uniref:UDP-glucose 4-epimerase GalE n=1 Tax=unclassified Synechococcus TaxID=2626047 RepID=UPI0020CD73A1|nr:MULTISPECIES: UDP-glucose 4-epimerase GalE [unclassified Synechococcus]MCP9819943.1 UDP-glucose 4-epimerase GalE [Synechococcus sp. Cruz-9H2]MCP9844249.1 UDP-glucose 4-epimerase GalE [Synechococcus sp. Edmonson 11F2]MCP9856373.1 UDP-glucose 4-epimerase GalE [Synechococcus sp. Cruz-9C9]MCP9863658.1 UDP-glucose 4-epimerase GalE [Synechococcus sp. Cruz-7E5]MCP9870854.1 UDP-glucose 4-epimerase GalE [Synechococcus sp. Cruz-7B9]